MTESSSSPRPPDPTSTVVALLGPLEVTSGGDRLALPRSKKTRALLGYLAMTGRAHHRERLCSLLWSETDDPRGALRWSLSRLRKALDETGPWIEADRTEVALRTEGVFVDAVALGRALGSDLAEMDVASLERLASLSRGEFMVGLGLADNLEFNAWCIAQRERCRDAHARVLGVLVDRLRDEPDRALNYAREHARVDTFDVGAQAGLLRLLVDTGRADEARRHFERGRRLYREVDAAGLGELEGAWRSMVVRQRTSTRRPETPPPVTPTVAPEPSASLAGDGPFIGRARECALLDAALAGVAAGEPAGVVLIQAEPGGGKSRLAERFAHTCSAGGFAVVRGRAYEGESSRPFGPWVDALSLDLDALVGAGTDGPSVGDRDALFASVSERLDQIAAEGRGVVVILDDIQWLDRDSAELLHFIARTQRNCAALIVVLARGGELSDNADAERTLRSLRRAQALTELELAPLGVEEVARLVGGNEARAAEIYAASAGNPLFAIEIARAKRAGIDNVPATVVQVVRERLEHLPDNAIDVLRWGAVLGHAVDLERVEALSSLDLEALVDALERLEQDALLKIDASKSSQRYVFSHDVVREAVYGDLSTPRRRLMHRKVARLLQDRMREASVATEVAHHAGLGGEALLGVRACVTAGRQSLRMFANGDAEALVRRGLRLVEDLDGGERIEWTLELLSVQFTARTPDRAQAAKQVRALAERALDLGLTRAARLGFQMLSFLRWESASMADAHANIMQAERVSRSAEPVERTVALAQAAKCLVLLERNLGQAEAFVMEADALTSRTGRSTSAVAFATGMIAAHRGETDVAVESFREARRLAREEGQRLAEFCAVEHWVMLEIDRDDRSRALDMARELIDLGTRVRPGAEGPAARALLAYVQHDCPDADPGELERAIEALREVDAKYELSFILTRWARACLACGRVEQARALALDALEVAKTIGRPSETALALTILARAAELQGESESRQAWLDALAGMSPKDLSLAVRTWTRPLSEGA